MAAAVAAILPGLAVAVSVGGRPPARGEGPPLPPGPSGRLSVLPVSVTGWK